MYATCLFCNKPLGQNESIEHFPIGRRLAKAASYCGNRTLSMNDLALAAANSGWVCSRKWGASNSTT